MTLTSTCPATAPLSTVAFGALLAFDIRIVAFASDALIVSDSSSEPDRLRTGASPSFGNESCHASVYCVMFSSAPTTSPGAHPNKEPTASAISAAVEFVSGNKGVELLVTESSVMRSPHMCASAPEKSSTATVYSAPLAGTDVALIISAGPKLSTWSETLCISATLFASGPFVALGIRTPTEACVPPPEFFWRISRMYGSCATSEIGALVASLVASPTSCQFRRVVHLFREAIIVADDALSSAKYSADWSSEAT